MSHGNGRKTMSQVVEDAATSARMEDTHCYLPTAEEIREACEAIRSTWTEQMESSRRVQVSPELGTQQIGVVR